VTAASKMAAFRAAIVGGRVGCASG